MTEIEVGTVKKINKPFPDLLHPFRPCKHRFISVVENTCTVDIKRNFLSLLIRDTPTYKSPGALIAIGECAPEFAFRSGNTQVVYT